MGGSPHDANVPCARALRFAQRAPAGTTGGRVGAGLLAVYAVLRFSWANTPVQSGASADCEVVHSAGAKPHCNTSFRAPIINQLISALPLPPGVHPFADASPVQILSGKWGAPLYISEAAPLSMLCERSIHAALLELLVE